MKKNIIWFVAALLLLAGCLDDDNNYDYRQVNSNDGYKVTNMEDSYTCFEGESVLLEPKIKFSIDSLNPDASYEWYVDGVVKSKEPTYLFVSENPGTTVIVFCSIDNKTGVKFPTKVKIEVISQYLQGWLLLSAKTGTDESQLSMVLMKEEKRARMEDGKEVQFDTIIYVGAEKDIFPSLGFGPKKLTENFTFDENWLQPEQLGDEILVIQRDKCLEINGNTMGLMAYPEDDFIGKAPVGFEPKDAVGNYACKYFLDENGYVYFGRNAVAIDLHTCRYLPDPAFGGRKVKSLTAAHKVVYGHAFGLALDENNTLFGIINAVTVSNEKGFDNGLMEDVGRVAKIDAGSYDESRFTNIPGEVLFNDVAYYDGEGARFLSFIKQDGKCYSHLYTLYYYREPPITVDYSGWFQVDANMFTAVKDVAVFQHKNYAVVANGNELWHYYYGESGDQGKKIKTFNKPIVSISPRDFGERSDHADVAHLGVALEDGEFYIYELSMPDVENVNLVNMKELYSGTGFGKIVDVLCKYGESANMGFL